LLDAAGFPGQTSNLTRLGAHLKKKRIWFHGSECVVYWSSESLEEEP